jgi:DNA-binding MarR family transcriptional regulator
MEIFTERQRRKAQFSEFGRLFGEPAWDLLLCTFIATESGTGLPMSTVAACIGSPLNTTSRHAETLKALGLVSATRDSVDTRRSLLFITPEGARKMRAFLEKNSSARCDQVRAHADVARPPTGRC